MKPSRSALPKFAKFVICERSGHWDWEIPSYLLLLLTLRINNMLTYRIINKQFYFSNNANATNSQIKIHTFKFQFRFS